MTVLLAVSDPGSRALWEGILTDHGHRSLFVTPDLGGWDEAVSLERDIGVVFQMAIVEVASVRAESLELCHRLSEQSAESRPTLMVLLPDAEAPDLLAKLRSADDVVLGQPDRRTAVSHLAALERRRHLTRPILPTAGELASGYDRPGRPASAGPVRAMPALALEPLPLAAPESGVPSRSLGAEAAERVARPAVLLIDDEPDVRYPLKLALQHAGYRVLEAEDGEDGLEIIARQGDEIALVVVDQRMRRVSGLEVLRQVRRRERRVPVVLMSSYPSLEPPGGPAGPDARLRKPFELLDLARTVHRLIGGDPAAA